LRAQAAQKFADTIAQYSYHLATGFIGTPRLLPALHAAGRDDLAYALLLEKTYPSWLYQVNLGATTMWETLDGWTTGLAGLIATYDAVKELADRTEA